MSSRVDMSYGERGGAEVPIAVGVLGDLAGDAELPALERRRFVDVGGPELAAAFGALRPELRLMLEDERGQVAPVRLAFGRLADFTQAALERRFGARSSEAASPAVDAGSLLDRILDAEPRASGAAHLADQVLNDERFQRLHAAWLGLAHLAERCGEHVSLAALSATRAELARDLEAAPDLEHACLFERLYSDAFEAGGRPFAALVADFDFSTHPDDVDLLRYLAIVASEAQTPVLAGAAPHLLDSGWDDFAPLATAGDLGRCMSGPQHASWRSLRQEPELRHVTLGLPRWRGLAAHAPLVSAAYLIAGRLIAAYERHGWPAALCDAEFDTAGLGVECTVPDAARRALSAAGLAVIGTAAPEVANLQVAATVHEPPSYHDARATASARVMASLPWVAAAGRVHQTLLCIARDSNRTPRESGETLRAWLASRAAEPAAAQGDPAHPLVFEGEAEVTADGFVQARVRPAYQLPPVSGTARVSLPLPGFQ